MSCVRSRFFSRTGQDISCVGNNMLTSRTKRVRRNKTTCRKKTLPPGFEPTTSGHVADMSPTFPTKLCLNCEGMQALKRGCQVALKHLNLILACVQCLKTCLDSEQLEDANAKCVFGECGHCGFNTLWSRGIHQNMMRYNDDSDWEFVPSAFFGTDVWKEQLDWQYYTYKSKPTVAKHALQLSHGNGGNAGGGKDKARNLVLDTKRGSLIDFLNKFKGTLQAHVQHRNLVSSEYQSKKNYERNARPGIIV
mmetsp:Transcript_29630/g.62301  ORF Transcript_29630/g.62301 Transcript_29630/m.62301 type:complete len:250 (+) Transcript_29630:1600-2349(+)